MRSGSYVSGGRRYPVVYFLYGLPADPSASTGNAFVADALVRYLSSGRTVARGAR